MNQGESGNWSSIGSGGNVQKVNGNIGNMDQGSEKVVEGQGVPNLTFNLPKRVDDSPEDVSKTDLPNGHSSSDSVNEMPRRKSIGELLQEESDELADTELISPTKDNPEEKETPGNEADKADESSSNEKDNDKSNDSSDEKLMDVDSKEDKKLSKPEDSQDMFDTSDDGTKSTNDVKSKEKEKPKEVEESQGFNSFKLEVSESQFFKDADSSQDSAKEETEQDGKDKDADEVKDVDEEMKDEQEVQSKTPPSPGPSVKTEESSTEPSERPTVQSDNPESMQSIRTTPSVAEPCNCDPSCHVRVHSISERLSSACKQLGDFIKLKRRVENPDLTNLLSVLTSIESIAENKPQAMSSPLPDQVFYAEIASAKKKSNARARYETSTPQKEPVEKKPRKIDTPNIVVPEEKVNFQSIKGLAVFAKWPNSGWYYPGVIEGLCPSDWKEATNVTVTFYDGLVREMKNINILPANLIPPGVILCDLDDETEMLVNSSKSIEDNNVEFKLSMKDDPKTVVDSGFNKLAIRATHMKSIKQVLEPSVDVVPKKMHMVSLDNLVSGRRSRVRTSKEDADDIADTPRKGTRKSVRKAAENPMDDEAMDDEEPTPATPSRKRSSSIDQSSTPKRSAKRGKQ